jgi:hypothetical protein
VDTPDNQKQQSLEVAGERTLVLKRSDGGDTLTLKDRDGKLAVSIVVTPDAITLHLGGACIEVNVERSLSIAAEHIALHGREGLALQTEGTLATTGRRQQLTATHGNVDVKANDDVKLNGERILLNC